MSLRRQTQYSKIINHKNIHNLNIHKLIHNLKLATTKKLFRKYTVQEKNSSYTNLI